MLWIRFRNIFIIFVTLTFESKGNDLNSRNKDLSDNFNVISYEIELEVYDTSTFIKGSTKTWFISDYTGEQIIILELSNNINVDSVLVEGEKTGYTHSNDSLKINLVTYSGQQTNITVFYYGNGNYSKYGVQTKYLEDIDQYVTWTLSEPYYSKYWFPVKQDLNDKADSVKVSLIVDSHLTGVSNGELTEKITLPGDKTKFIWKSHYPIDYYLISFAVSDYLKYEIYAPLDNGDSVRVENYIYNNIEYINNNINNIDRTKELIKLFSELFGNYPFMKEKYGHVVAPIGGGMEHQTITTLSDFSFLLMAHELAHQWFGDYVTCNNWNNIWINEGFASYAEYLAYEFLESKEDADKWLRDAIDYVMNDNSGSIFIYDTLPETNRIFNQRLSYKKGAVLIHMIRKKINNDDIFFNILKDFLKNYAYKNAGAQEFMEVAVNLSGLDLSDFFTMWYYGEGFPVLNITWKQIGNRLDITTEQIEPDNNTFNIELECKLQFFTGDDSTINLPVIYPGYSESFNIRNSIIRIIPDPDSLFLVKVNNINRISTSYFDNDIAIISNPSLNYIQILFYEPLIYDIALYDITGIKVFHREKVQDNSFIIPSDNLGSGIKILTVKNNQGKIICTKTIIFN